MAYVTASILLLLAAVAIVFFHRWISSRPDFSRDEIIRSWDVFIKLVAAIVAIVGGLFAILRYTDQQRQELQRERRIETRNTFQGAIRASSSLAAFPDLTTPAAALARSEFEQLYLGSMVLVEGPLVETAMVRFRNAILEWERTGTKPSGLDQLALAVSNACNEELKPLR
jgi:hypothetical protein